MIRMVLTPSPWTVMSFHSKPRQCTSHLFDGKYVRKEPNYHWPTTEGKKLIKGRPNPSHSLAPKEAFHHNSLLPLLSTMMFYKPLVSLVVAFAAASSVAAAAAPEARGGKACEGGTS